MTNEEWQEVIRKNVAEHTVLSPAHIMYYPQVEGITPTVISEKEKKNELRTITERRKQNEVRNSQMY